jgi:GT2 family glycosyltransferase
MNFFVIIPVHNRVHQTLRTVECLADQKRDDITLMLVDDGSTDDTRLRVGNACVDRMRLEVIAGAGDLWWGGAMRLGVDWVLTHSAPGDVAVMMNNDVTFASDLFARAERILHNNPRTILGSVVQNESDGSTYYAGGIMRSWPLALTYWPLLNQLDSKQPLGGLIEVDFLGGEATFVPMEAFKVAGNINGKLLPHYHADSEFVFRAKQHGFRVATSPDLVVMKSVHSTARFSDFTTRESLRYAIPSLFVRRSANNIRDRLVFAWLACPRRWLAFFVVADICKLLVRVGSLCIFGRRVFAAKVWLNRFLVPRT